MTIAEIKAGKKSSNFIKCFPNLVVGINLSRNFGQHKALLCESKIVEEVLLLL
jgi:hypothetical protein